MLASIISLYLTGTFNQDLKDIPAPASNTEIALITTASANLETFLSEELAPIKNKDNVSPVIYANGAIAIDKSSGSILFEKNSNSTMPIASITKLMTILIIMEEGNMDDIVTVSNAAANIEGSQMYLRAGEKISVRNLLYGALIPSANDAASALAEYNAGSVSAFVEKMNQKAQELGLKNTHFANPTGLDNSNNYSTAYDIAKLSEEVYKHPFIKESATIKELAVYSEDGKITHNLQSTNELLDSYLDIRGLKTGTTDMAGECLTAIVANPQGKEIVTVVLHSPSRFKESKILADWVFRSYTWQ